jgi:hypothetical protein
LRNNYPDEATVVVTEIPGFWFRLFSGKTVNAQTNPIVERNLIAESVLELSYEIEHPLTLVRAYDMTKGEVSDENYVSINHVWNRVSYSSADGSFVSYSVNGVDREIALSNLNRESFFEYKDSPKKLTFYYFNNEIRIAQNIIFQNDVFPITIVWELSPAESEISNVALYLSTFFDLSFAFEEAYIPGLLDWENPWSKPSEYYGNDWAVVNFCYSSLTDNYLGFYDEAQKVVFALNFKEVPDWGNVGVLSSRQIDALRFQYIFDKININQQVSFTYQVLTFWENSFPAMQNVSDLENLFNFKPATSFDITSRDYHEYIGEFNIRFLVYDKNQLNTKIIGCRLLEIVYSNDRYVIFKIKG